MKHNPHLFLIMGILFIIFPFVLAIDLVQDKYVFVINPYAEAQPLTAIPGDAVVRPFNPVLQRFDRNPPSLDGGGASLIKLQAASAPLPLTGTPLTEYAMTKAGYFAIGVAVDKQLNDFEIVEANNLPLPQGASGEDPYFERIRKFDVIRQRFSSRSEDLPIQYNSVLQAGEAYLLKAKKAFTIRLKAAPVVEPTISISSPAAGATVTTSSVDVQFAAQHADGKKIKVLLDGQQVGALLDPTATSATVSGLTDGSRTIKVEVVNDDTDGTSLPSPVFQEVPIIVDLPVTFSGVAGSGCETQQDENKKQCTVSAQNFITGAQLAREKEMQTCARAETSTAKSIMLEWQTSILGVGQACRVDATGKACAQTAWPPTLTDGAGTTHFQRPAANACP